MEMNCFDIYRELWIKFCIVFVEEYNIEFNDLKKIIEIYKIFLFNFKYLYDYRRGIIGQLEFIEGEDYLIKFDEKLSEKIKIINKWLYFDDDKKEEIYNVYIELKILDKVKCYYKIIIKYKNYFIFERRR